MIQLTRLNGLPFYCNSDLIETVEETPDTVITMTTGKKLLVEESADSIVEKIISFRNRCLKPAGIKNGHGSKDARQTNAISAVNQVIRRSHE